MAPSSFQIGPFHLIFFCFVSLPAIFVGATFFLNIVKCFLNGVIVCFYNIRFFVSLCWWRHRGAITWSDSGSIGWTVGRICEDDVEVTSRSFCDIAACERRVYFPTPFIRLPPSPCFRKACETRRVNGGEGGWGQYYMTFVPIGRFECNVFHASFRANILRHSRKDSLMLGKYRGYGLRSLVAGYQVL